MITSSNLTAITATGTITSGTWNGSTISVGYGGTNATTIGGAGAVPYSTGTAYAFSAAGTLGQALISGGTGAPTWFAPTAGSILFAGANGILSQDNSGLFYDATNHFLGLGTATPTQALSVIGNINVGNKLLETESFESASFPPSGWTTGGNANWSRVTSDFKDGSASTQSGVIADSQETWIDRDYTFANPGGLIKFYWKVSSEGGLGDYLLFCVDNDACTSSSGYANQISGTNGSWVEVSYTVATAGTHSFRWKYAKNSSGFVGSDAGWVDNIRTYDSADSANLGNIFADGNITAGGNLTVIGDGSGSPLKVGNNGETEVLTILNNGNIGIGTTKETKLYNGDFSSRFLLAQSTPLGGLGNVALGFGALGSLTSSDQNVGIGLRAGEVVNGGQRNTMVGSMSGLYLSGGSDNVILGNYAATTLTTGSNNIIIGASANVPASNSAYYLNIGGTLYGNLTSKYIGIGTATPTHILSLGSAQAQKIWIENTANTVVGRALTIAAGSTLTGGTANMAGGNLILSSGAGKGTGASSISFLTGTTLTTGSTLQSITEKMTILGNGNVGIGVASPTARLQLPAGTATAGTAPFKFTSGVNLTTAEAGALEWDGTNLFITQTTGPVRKTLAYTTDLSGGYVPYTGATGNVNLGAYSLISPNILGGSLTTSALTFQTTSGVGIAGADMHFKVGNNGGTEAMTILNNGNVGIGITNPTAKLHLNSSIGTVSLEINSNAALPGKDVLLLRSDVVYDDDPVFRVQADGLVFADGAYTGTGADYAEYFYTKDANLQPGEAVCIDLTTENGVKRCQNNGDNNLMGIVSSKPSIIGNKTADQEKDPTHYAIIGMLGQVKGKVSTENGSLSVGDSLTAGSKPGEMRRANAGESTVGIALQNFAEPTGSIQILISRRNQSLTVEKVTQAVTDNIAALNIQDQVDNLIAQASKNLDSQLSTQAASLIDLQLQLTDAKTTASYLQAQLDLIKTQNQTITEFIAILDPAKLIYKDTLGNLDLAGGKLTATEVETGLLTIKVLDKDAPTIGEASITAIMTDDNQDGLDDNSQSNGKELKIKTTAVTNSAKIYLTPIGSTKNQVLYVKAKIVGDSFTVAVDEVVTGEISFNWWLVEEKKEK